MKSNALLIPILALTLIAGTLLVACSSLAPSPTATPLPPTETPIPPTPTQTPTPTNTPTPTPTPTSTPTPTPTPLPLVISSSAFEPGGDIPERFGFFRENVSPELTWNHVPQGTRSLALLMEDRNFPFTHWVVYDIPPDAAGLPEGVLQQPQLPEGGGLQGLNTNAEIGYIGPYPPRGEEHRYAFTLYALDAPPGLEPGATREQVLAAMEGHILTTSEVTGTYLGVEP